MISLLLVLVTAAQAIGLNDHLHLTLDGGEVVEGYFLRATPSEVVMTRPHRNGTSRIPIDIVKLATVNGEVLARAEFVADVQDAWSDWKAWADEPPPHPHPFGVALLSAGLSGAGHGALGQWDRGTSMMAVDLVSMSIAGVELSGRGTGRVDVLMSAVAVSLFFKSYAISDSVRAARRTRNRLREAAQFDEKAKINEN